MNARIITVILGLVLGLFVLSACTTQTPQPQSPIATPIAIEIANPATAHCELKGYRSQIRTTEDGSQYGVCVFPDGSECEEWAFYRGECKPVPENENTETDSTEISNPASVNCVQNSGRLDLRTTAEGAQYGVCIFQDGSECEEWAYLRGECSPGSASTSTQEGGSQIANPASAYCQENGGKVELRTADDGTQAGACVFPDGSECDEWAYYRGECAPGTKQP